MLLIVGASCFISEPLDSGRDVDAFQPIMTGVQPLEICGNVFPESFSSQSSELPRTIPRGAAQSWPTARVRGGETGGQKHDSHFVSARPFVEKELLAKQ